MSKQDKDIRRASILATLWILAFYIGSIIGGVMCIVITISATAIAAMYIKFDLERERREREARLKREQFKARLTEAENND